MTEQDVRAIIMGMVGKILEVNDEAEDKAHSFAMRGVVLYEGNRAIRRIIKCLSSE